MDKVGQLIIYIVFAAMSAVLIAYSLIKLRKKRLTPSMVVMISMMLAWQTILILTIFFEGTRTERLLADLKLPFISLTMAALLVFVLRFYSMDAYITPHIIFLLCIVPAITLALALTTNQHSYLRSYTAVFTPSFHYESSRGIWYWIHAAYGYFLTVMTLVIVVLEHKRTPPAYRSTSRLLVYSMIVTIGCNILHISGLLTTNMDPTLVAMSVIELLLFILTINNQGVEFLRIARNDIFNRLTGGLFILDTEGGIISRNPNAEELMRRMGMDEYERSFAEVLKAIEQKSYESAVFSDEDEGMDFHITARDGERHVVNMIERIIKDNTQKEMGKLVVFTDVTENRLLIEKLEKKAGYDTLTGLYNRRRFEELRFAMDTPANLPITVLAADLNGLKTINDTMGHRMGDLFIRFAANKLLTRCPPNALVARTGGDEFLALIPSFPSKSAAELVSDIKAHMKNSKYFDFEPSIALGFAVKNSAAQKLDDLINIADRAMYADKALSREGRAAASPVSGNTLYGMRNI